MKKKRKYVQRVKDPSEHFYFTSKRIAYRREIAETLGFTTSGDFVKDWHDLLNCLYTISGMSTTCIAETLGFTPHIIRRDMKALGIPTYGWKRLSGVGCLGFPNSCVKHRVCIYCQTPFSTIYSKEVTCQNPECKKKFYHRNDEKKKRARRYEDFM